MRTSPRETKTNPSRFCSRPSTRPVWWSRPCIPCGFNGLTGTRNCVVFLSFCANQNRKCHNSENICAFLHTTALRGACAMAGFSKSDAICTNTRRNANSKAMYFSRSKGNSFGQIPIRRPRPVSVKCTLQIPGKTHRREVIYLDQYC